MKRFTILFGLLFLIESQLFAQTQTTGFTFSALNGCTQITKAVTSNHPGRFIWKPKAAHFNSAVIIGPRLYNDPISQYVPLTVSIYSPVTGRRLLSTRLKSHSRCTGKGEDLCADTWITPNSYTGSRISKRFGPILVRLKPTIQNSSKDCRYYYIPRPSRRRLYANM